MEAAEKAGVHIDNLCGGKGVCGRCVDECPQGAIVLRPYQTPGTLGYPAGMSLKNQEDQNADL